MSYRFVAVLIASALLSMIAADPARAQSTSATDVDFDALILRDFIAYDADYERNREVRQRGLDGLNELSEQGRPPEHDLGFLDRISSPNALLAYLEALRVSEIASTGRDNRDELGAATTVVSQVLFKSNLRRLYREHGRSPGIDHSLAGVYRGFLDSWQDSRAGYWGAWYISRGKLYRSADLSFTYHTVAYRRGQVNYLDRIVRTTLEIKDRDYPYGWLHRGRYNNHNNYDVVRIFALGWPLLSESEKALTAQQIGELVHWTVSQSLASDGSFVVDQTFYNRTSDAYYFGVSFLDAAGYWDNAKRFWTDADFPEAIATCRAIKARLEFLALEGESAVSALRKLRAC
ncbi:MAG: hypothetical protein GY791_04745 [Alphaproteobacteria bacterium]|nr:hypothetical protein [Alphaproteobacteria bacterium]